MEATQENTRIANEITSILAGNNCTVAQASEILSYVAHMIRVTAKVQL